MKEAKIAGMNLRKLTCPVCDQVIGDSEIREHLSKKDLQDI